MSTIDEIKASIEEYKNQVSKVSQKSPRAKYILNF